MVATAGNDTVGGVYPQLSNPTLLNDAINLIVEVSSIALESTIANSALLAVTPAVQVPTPDELRRAQTLP